jgi:tetratricopeptide (TPR) repeat protein
MNSARFFAPATLLFVLTAACVSAEQTPNVPPTNPHALPPPPAQVDWKQKLQDFQSTDAAIQQAATNTFLASGFPGYSQIASLLTHENKDVVARATEVRKQLEQRSQAIFQQTVELHTKMQDQPLSAENYKQLGEAWLAATPYIVKNDQRQICFQQAAESKNAIARLDQMNKQLAALDNALAEMKPEQAVERSSHLQSRAELLQNLQRFPDAIKAAELIIASDKTGRFVPAALKLQASLHMRIGEIDKGAAACQRILQEFPRSLEVKSAHQLLIENLIGQKKIDEAIDQVKQFYAACPIDEDAQESIDSMLNYLTEEHDFKRIAGFTDWMQKTLPVNRCSANVYKYGGAANEYLLRDYVKAELSYTVLREKYTDEMEIEHLDNALRRLKAKKMGVFPKESTDADAGVAGVLAQFLKAVRTRDVAAVKMLVPRAEQANFANILGQSGGEFVTEMIVGDFIVKELKPEGATDMTLVLDHYGFNADQPEKMEQKAVKEDGEWKILWDVDAGEE